MQRNTLTRKAEATKTKSTAGRLVARSGIEAVNATERLICGAGAVDVASVAQGLALAGRRAATLLADGRSQPPAHSEQCHTVSWVHHQLAGGQLAACGCMAFELEAGNPQEAVDHCLVAHHMAERLGLPGQCTLDQSIAEGLHLLRLPSESMVADLLGRDEASSTADDVLAAAGDAFQAVSELTGRGCTAVRTHRLDDAKYLLVCPGSASKRAFNAADQLREAGIACGVVAIKLTRPFPEEEVRALLGGGKEIAVVNALRTALRSTLSSESSAKVRPLVEVEAEAAAAAFGLTFDPGPTLDESDPTVMLGVSPAGPWSDKLLLDGAGLLGRLTYFNLNRPPHRLPGMSALALGAGSLGQEVDLLFVAEPFLLRGDEELLERVREGGLLVFGSRGASPQEIGLSLGERRLRQIGRRNLKVSSFDLTAAAAHDDSSPETTRTLLLGALLAAGDEIAGPIGYEGDVISAISAAEESGDLEEGFVELLHEGAAALQRLDPDAMEEKETAAEEDFRPPSSLPLMPEPSGEASDEDWRGELRRFYLTGAGAYSEAEPLAALPLMPAGLGPLAEIDRKWRDYPLVLSEEKGVIGLTELLDITLDDIEQSGIEIPILREHRGRLSRAAGRLLEGKGLIPFQEVLDEACELFGDELDLSEAGEAGLEEELYRLKARLPQAHSMIGLGKETLLRLYEAAVRAERGPQAAFRDEILKRIAQMEDLLLADKAYSEEGASAAAMAAAIGDADNTFVDAEVLASSLPQRRGSTGLEPIRRQRVEKALAAMKGYIELAKEQPPLILLHHGQIIGAPAPGARVIEHQDGLEAAIGLFDGLAANMAEVFRAIRTAGLEHRGAYDPGRHDALLARFDWRAFNEDELSLLPPIMVMESGRRLRGWAAASLSALLRSGRPIHVLAVECVADARCDEGAEGLADINPGFGFFAIAHREAFVLQSTLAYPDHLIAGLKRMMKVPRPAITLVAEPAWEAPVSPWLQLAAARSGRGTPTFGYDADAGLTWAECFDLSGNPQPEAAWPVRETRITNAAGEEQIIKEAFTFAHAAALDPMYRSHFRVIPTEVWNEDQFEISTYLAAGAEERRRKVPYIWIVGEDGELARAVMTQAMIFACRDRRRAWRILQELGGADNEYARRAAAAARQETLVEAEEARRELEAAHTEAVEQARATAAGEAMERLVSVLMNEDALASMAGIAPAPVPAPRPAAAEAVEAVVEEQEEEEQEETISFADPYITSALCTTCNECTNLNKRMFQYNANKQAVITDAKAGTFAELVKAAEKCPARCIHPGAPRDDDDTATEDLIAKAAQFN